MDVMARRGNQPKSTIQQSRALQANAYTLLELIVVIAGLGILASLAIPNFLKYLEGAKNDEASALMSSIGAECLQNYRKDKTELDKTPRLLERNGPPRDFKIEEGNDKCSMILITPKNESDTSLASFGVMTKLNPKNNVPYIYKFGSYAHPDAEAACLSWASFKEDGSGNVITPKQRACDEGGNVEEIRARIAAEAAERERLRLIQARYDAWLAGPPPATGNYTADGKNVWAFQGSVVPNKEEFDKAVERECGRELVDALNKAKADKHDGPYTYTGKSGGCSIDTYLCSGTDVGNKDGYDACKEKERQERCTAAEGRWKDSGVNGKFSESGCEVKWQCNKEILTSQADYDASPCGVTCRTVKVQVRSTQSCSVIFGKRRCTTVPIYEDRQVCS